MEKTRAIRVVSPTLSAEKVEEILETTHPFAQGKHLLYPADTNGPHSHLPAFFYLKKWVSHPDAVLLTAGDLAGWVQREKFSLDFIFAPADPPVMKIAEKISSILEKPVLYLEYLPSGRFGEKINPPEKLAPGKRVLVFNGVSTTGRCVGERLPSFVEKGGARVAAISAFAKGTAPGVEQAEKKYGDRFYAGIQVDIPMYPPDPEKCPLCRKKIALTKWNEEAS